MIIDTYVYIIGFLMGILILILFIEYFPSNKASDNIETFEEQNDNKENKEDDKIERS